MENEMDLNPQGDEMTEGAAPILPEEEELEETVDGEGDSEESETPAGDESVA